MDRRSFSIGAMFAGIAAALGIKSAKAAEPFVVKVVDIDTSAYRTFTDEDGNFFGADAMAHTRDCLDFLYKVYPAELMRSFQNGVSKEERDADPTMQSIYVRHEYDVHKIADLGQAGYDALIEENLEKFIQGYYAFRASGFEDTSLVSQYMETLQ